jgi:uncharacterized protein
MAGLDRHRLRPLSGFAEVIQSIDTILTTGIGERVMRRWFGSTGAAILGRLLNAKTVLLFMTVIATAIDLFEPRFKVMRLIPGNNSPEAVRGGAFSFVIEGEYRPRAHLGDPRPEGIKRITLAASQSGLSFIGG